MKDIGSAGFSTSAGARNVTNAMNPLTPGGASPKNVHLPTLGWMVVFVVAAFLVYHYVIKKGRK